MKSLRHYGFFKAGQLLAKVPGRNADEAKKRLGKRLKQAGEIDEREFGDPAPFQNRDGWGEEQLATHSFIKLWKIE